MAWESENPTERKTGGAGQRESEKLRAERTSFVQSLRTGKGVREGRNGNRRSFKIVLCPSFDTGKGLSICPVLLLPNLFVYKQAFSSCPPPLPQLMKGH